MLYDKKNQQSGLLYCEGKTVFFFFKFLPEARTFWSKITWVTTGNTSASRSYRYYRQL